VQGLGFYNDFFGVSYPFGKYDQLFVPEFNQVWSAFLHCPFPLFFQPCPLPTCMRKSTGNFWSFWVWRQGAMENAGAVTFSEHYLFRDPPTQSQRTCPGNDARTGLSTATVC
jgi:hypothetical protein